MFTVFVEDCEKIISLERLMLCHNCGKSILGINGECEFCGAPLNVTPPNEKVMVSNESPKLTFKEKFERVFFFVFWCIMIYFGIVWLHQKNVEKEFYEHIYQQAVNELLNHWGDPDNIDIADYKKEYVNMQEWDYHDFGYGNLRYGRYEVTVPIEYDDGGRRYEESPTLNVYYYTSNQNVTDGIDTSVKDHLYTPDMFQEKWDQIFENVE